MAIELSQNSNISACVSWEKARRLVDCQLLDVAIWGTPAVFPDIPTYAGNSEAPNFRKPK